MFSNYIIFKNQVMQQAHYTSQALSPQNCKPADA
jgi:hypothetical protein